MFEYLLSKMKLALTRPVPVYAVVLLLMGLLILTSLAALFRSRLEINAPSNHIELTELIRTVKCQLYRAEMEGLARGEAPLFAHKEVILEVDIEERRESEGEVRGELKVFVVSGKATTGSGRTQRIEL